MEIGAQLYTVRDFCKTPENFAETLKKIADIGYRTVQVSGTCAYEPEWLARQLKETGLRCVLTHYNLDKIKKEPEQTVAAHKQFGCKYIGIGCMPGPLEQSGTYDHFVADFLAPAKAIAANGALMMYHNHHIEFMRDGNGKLYLERLAEDFAPEELGFTLDTYWVQYGGGNPSEWIKKLSGRVPCIHLKDLAIVSGEQRMAVVGEGNINFDSVLSAAEAAGTSYLLVEQDSCYDENPFDCLKRSYQNLVAMGLK
ncbi:MAG: sugar phosphate isomerase/epimerase [Clostridiales bacterium]|nr:sugar phosphate isomerase/epimerase [Clostridiales bacterium]